MLLQTKNMINKNISAPIVVDFNVNGMCNLDCVWCWGPDHKSKEELSIEEWKDIAKKLYLLGTKKITITGGETLMKEGLDDLVKYLYEVLNIHTTLSTNGILLKRKASIILPFINDIGLPLDGHTQALNNIMRRGPAKHFDRVLEAIKLVQDLYPKIDLTVRTVVSLKNFEYVHLIGDTMICYGINPKKLRWKLYQIAPLGIRKDDTRNGEWLISDEVFSSTINKIKQHNLSFDNISALTLAGHVDRYFHIYPDGRSHVIVGDKDGRAVELSVGNIRNFEITIENLNKFNLSNNQIR